MSDEEKIICKKGKEKWYPKYAPHIILGTNKSIFDEIYQGFTNGEPIDKKVIN